jgi:hypothetical protein
MPPGATRSAARAGDFRGFVPMDDRSTLSARLDEFRTAHRRSVLAVFPVRIGSSLDTECAVHLARTLPRAAICQSGGIVRPVAFLASRPAANEKTLWELAREVRDYVRKHPTGADYTLYAEYVLSADQSEYQALYLVLCDARGEWVIVDRQDFRPPDERDLRPNSKDEANALVVRRLQAYLADAPYDSSRLAPAPAPQPVARAASQPFSP